MGFEQDPYAAVLGDLCSEHKIAKLATTTQNLQVVVERMKGLLRVPRIASVRNSERTMRRNLGFNLSSLAVVLVFASILRVPNAGAQVLLRATPTPSTQANAESTSVDISASGQVLVFQSTATNWQTGANGTETKIVWIDLANSSVRVVSNLNNGTALSSGNIQPSISGAGQFVAFVTSAPNTGFAGATGKILVRKNVSSGELLLVSASNAGVPALGSAGGQAQFPSISRNGRFVSFSSDANNLISGDTASTTDIFIKDLDTGAIELVSQLASGGFSALDLEVARPNAMSADGNLVLFETSRPGFSTAPSNGVTQIYLRNRSAATNELISRSPAGLVGNNASAFAAISPNGRFVAFRSFASNLVLNSIVMRVFVLDRVSGTMDEIALPSLDGAPATRCERPDVANDGTVLFVCSNFANEQVFIRRPGSMPQLFSQNSSGAQANLRTGASLAINANGLGFAFESLANNLVSGDTNGLPDVFYQVDPSLLDSIFANGFE